jgi:starch phosphorylase
VGDQYLFRAQVYLDDLRPDAVQVELYADPIADEPPVRQAMSRSHALIGALRGYLYSACVPASRPVHHYTPRIVPHHAAVAVPLEAVQILW